MSNSRFISAGSINWHAIDQGEGRPVLLVHGTAASAHSWRKVIPLLTPHHRVIAVDLPGHGRTRLNSSRDLNLTRMAQGISALAKGLAVDFEVVAGHSAGAAILIEALARHQLKAARLVSFNGAFYPFGGAAGSLFSPIAKLVALNPLMPRFLSSMASRATVERLLRDTGSKPTPEDIDCYYALLKQPGHVAAALGMMAAWDLSGMEASLAAVHIPCVLVAGDNDKSVPPRTADRAARCCATSKALHIPGYGHLLHEENPQLAADIILGSML
jgi:magnesium chelatase accessory protein